LESWVDTAAVVVSRNQVCVALFQDAWAAVAPPAFARHIDAILLCGTHEELVDKVATLMFKVP